MKYMQTLRLTIVFFLVFRPDTVGFASRRFAARWASFPFPPAGWNNLNEHTWSSFCPSVESHTRAVVRWCLKFPWSAALLRAPQSSLLAISLVSTGSCWVASLGCPLTTCWCWRCQQRKALGTAHVQSWWAGSVAKSAVSKGCDNSKCRRYWPGATGGHQTQTAHSLEN